MKHKPTGLSVIVVVMVLWGMPAMLLGAATVKTTDGLAVTFDEEGRVSAVSVQGKVLPVAPEAGGFWVTPVTPPDGEVGERVRVRARPEATPGGVRLSAQLEHPAIKLVALLRGGGEYIDVTVECEASVEEDQAFTVEFVLPLVPQEGWLWDQSLEHSEPIQTDESYHNWSSLGASRDIPVNRLPFSAIAAGEVGVSAAVPMHSPRVFRTSFQPEGYVVAFDLGLTQATIKFPGRADVRFVIYRNGPASTPNQGALRSAAQRYYDFFPELYLKRVTNEGSWGHFQGALTTVPRLVEDFGAVFTGSGSVTLEKEQYEATKAHNIYVAKHREPWAWWHLVYHKPDYRTDDPSPWRDYFLPATEDRPSQPSLEEELQLIDHQTKAPPEVKDGNDQIPGPLSEVAQAAKNCFIYDEHDRPVRINWHRWSQGWHSQWPLNVDPDIPRPNREDCARKYQFHNMYAWDDPDAYHVNGISWDSLTNWTAFRWEDFRRENFQYVDVPLTFHRRTGRVVAVKVFHDYEMAQAWSQEVRAKGRFIRANTDLQPWLFCGQFIELMGMERSADRVRESEMSLVRALCYQKPASYYRALSETGMRKCLFYGIHPGGLSVLRSPGSAEQARPLYRKYAPLIRTIAQAGWQPITGAHDRAGIAKVERFGSGDDALYFTVRTIGEEGGTVELAIDLAAVDLGGAAAEQFQVTELLERRGLACSDADGTLLVRFAIRAQETLVIELQSGK